MQNFQTYLQLFSKAQRTSENWKKVGNKQKYTSRALLAHDDDRVSN